MTKEELEAHDKKVREETEARLKKEFEEKQTAANKKYEEERAADRSRLARIEAERRQERIDTFAASCRIPALRPFIAMFADLATLEAAGVKKYTLDEKRKDLTAEAMVKEFIALANDSAVTKLFTVKSGGDKNLDKDGDHKDDLPQAHEDVAGAVDKLAKGYMAKNKVKRYSEALGAVLADPENAELAEAYRVLNGAKPAAA